MYCIKDYMLWVFMLSGAFFGMTFILYAYENWKSSLVSFVVGMILFIVGLSQLQCGVCDYSIYLPLIVK